jgi:CBS domain-containing protein
MSEAAIVAEALARLRALGAVAVKVHGGPYQPALNDVVGCYRGRAFLLEGKRPGERMTPRQARIAEQWAAAGAIVGVFTSADEAVALVTGGA